MNAGMDNPQSAIRNPQSKPILGLIGGIGSGKSLVSAEFAKHGGLLISGDALGHEALRQPDLMARVVERWGQEIVGADGSINRRALGKKVFAAASERKELEGIVFPYIERRIREEIAAAQETPAVRFVVLDAAVMLEAGWNNVCDWLVYVDVPRDVRVQRLAENRGWTEKELAAREAAQMPLTQKQQRADFTIDNGGAVEQTVRQVQQLLTKLRLGSP